MKRFLMHVMIVFFMAGGTVWANEPLTLEQAIFSALENNISLNRARTRIFSARTQVDKEKADAYPDLSLKADALVRHDKSPLQRAIWQSGDKDSQFTGLKLVSTVNVFNGSRDKLSLDRSRIELDAVKDDYDRSRQSVIFETISRFVNVVLNQQLIRVEERNLEVNQQQLERIDSFFKAGNRPVNDLYQQRAKTSQAELRVLAARHDLEVSKLLLSQIMGDLGKTDYNVSSPNPPLFEKSDNAPVTGQILSYALQNRKDISALEKNITALEKKIGEAKAGYWPQVTLSVQAGTNYNTLLDDYGFSDQFVDENPYAAVGLSMDLPIFDKKRTRTQLAQARITFKSEKLKLAELKQQVDLEVRKAVLDYTTTILQLDVAKNQLKFATQAFETSKERYEIGSSDLVALTQAMDQLAQASYEEVKAKYGHLLANLGIAYYSGELELRLADWKSAFRKKLSDEEPDR